MLSWQLYSGVRPPEFVFTPHILLITLLSIATSTSPTPSSPSSSHSLLSQNPGKSPLSVHPPRHHPGLHSPPHSIGSSARLHRAASVIPPPFIPGMTCPLLDRRRVSQLCPLVSVDAGTTASRGQHTSSRDQLQLSREFRDTRLSFCDAYTLDTALDQDCTTLAISRSSAGKSSTCEGCVRRALKLDRIARHRYAVFESLLTKVNCRTEYSRRWSCKDCKVRTHHGFEGKYVKRIFY